MTNHQDNKNKEYKFQDPLQTALFKAAKIGHINLMKEFIEVGADPFAPDNSGRSAIFYAMDREITTIADLLSQLDSKKSN